MCKNKIFIFLISLLLVPQICSASNGGMMTTPFYTSLLIGGLVVLAGVMNALYISNFIKKSVFKSKTLTALGLFWLFGGLIWLFVTLASYFNSVSGTNNFFVEKIAMHMVIGFGISVGYYLVYKNFFSNKLSTVMTAITVLPSILYSYMLLTGKWLVIPSDWGMLTLAPRPVAFILIVMGSIYCLMFLINILANLLSPSRRKMPGNKYNLIIDTAILIFIISATAEGIGWLPGWRMVINRMILLAASLTAFMAIYQTDFLDIISDREKSKLPGQNLKTKNVKKIVT
jgi:hypothetical protein